MCAYYARNPIFIRVELEIRSLQQSSIIDERSMESCPDRIAPTVYFRVIFSISPPERSNWEASVRASFFANDGIIACQMAARASTVGRLN